MVRRTSKRERAQSVFRRERGGRGRASQTGDGPLGSSGTGREAPPVCPHQVRLSPGLDRNRHLDWKGCGSKREHLAPQAGCPETNGFRPPFPVRRNRDLGPNRMRAGSRTRGEQLSGRARRNRLPGFRHQDDQGFEGTSDRDQPDPLAQTAPSDRGRSPHCRLHGCGIPPVVRTAANGDHGFHHRTFAYCQPDSPRGQRHRLPHDRANERLPHGCDTDRHLRFRGWPGPGDPGPEHRHHDVQPGAPG